MIFSDKKNNYIMIYCWILLNQMFSKWSTLFCREFGYHRNVPHCSNTQWSYTRKLSLSLCNFKYPVGHSCRCKTCCEQAKPRIELHFTYYYGLNGDVSCEIRLKPNPQCNGIKRCGLWKVIMLQGVYPHK
jgi:hypothetical protein